MSGYSYKIEMLTMDIASLQSAIELAKDQRADLLDIRNELMNEKRELESQESFINEPETDNESSHGTHAEAHEDERETARQLHEKAIERVEEMIQAVNDERDDLASQIQTDRAKVYDREDRISMLRQKQRAAQEAASR
ncbi:hypothetical protein NSQ26_07195 [Bacillus sp. FSL W7-1360]